MTVQQIHKLERISLPKADPFSAHIMVIHFDRNKSYMGFVCLIPRLLNNKIIKTPFVKTLTRDTTKSNFKFVYYGSLN